MPAINAYLAFNGNCAEAMRFYEGVFKGELKALYKNSDMPPGSDFPPGSEDRIMHAYLVFDGGSLMAGDSPAGVPYGGMKGFSLALQYDDTTEGKRVFEVLSEGGNVTMPWEATFWAEGFGMVTDKYGTPWTVNGKSLM